MSKVGDTNNKPVNKPKNYDPKGYVKSWRGPSGEIFPIDLSWLINAGELFEGITSIHKTTIAAIHQSWRCLSLAILGLPNNRPRIFSRQYNPLNTPDLFANAFPKYFTNEADLAEHIEEKQEGEWSRVQYAMQQGAFSVYGGSIASAMSGTGAVERIVPDLARYRKL